jgi:hypothetical protein
MIATSCPSFSVSGRSADLQRFLVSKLQAAMASSGSTLYALQWKEADMPSGPPICRLRASAPRTSGSGFGSERKGWPTPHLNSTTGPGAEGREGGLNIQTAAMLAGWPTAQSRDRFPAHSEEYVAAKKAQGHGMQNLNDIVMLAGWVTTTSRDWKDSGTDIRPRADGSARMDQLPRQANLAGWPTATRTDTHRGENYDPMAPNMTLNMAAQRVGPARLTASGEMLTGSAAGMENGGQLNPKFSLWLMGYPAAWASCGERAMQSCRKSPRRSSRLSTSP